MNNETSYYRDKLESLQDLFGSASVELVPGGVEVGERIYPVVDDVILCVDQDHAPASVRDVALPPVAAGSAYAPDVQRSFGQEWMAHPRLLAEHESEFSRYFDLIDLTGLTDLRICDLGCGMGRWAHFVAPICREVVLVDFSEAIFVARENLRHARNAIFIMADVLHLPFREGAFDFLYCLGVLHHLPVNGLSALRGLAPLAPRHLVYVYYALDNRPAYFRALLRVVSACRRVFTRIRSQRVRLALTGILTTCLYLPLLALGRRLGAFGRYLPLVDAYAGNSRERIRQDVYDRFFTPIEQRFTRAEIERLSDTFASIHVSDRLPYWHFVCDRR